MNEFLFLSFVALAMYALLFLWLGMGFMFTKQTSEIHKSNPSFFSIIICARNEEKTLGYCLKSILEQNYPPEQIQIIVVNDASDDATARIAQTLLSNSGIAYQIINNPKQQGKKASITQAILQARHPLIITRDADTFNSSKNWLHEIHRCFQSEHVDFIIGPVAIANNEGLLWALQAVETNVLSVLSCGSAYFNKAFLCSGANLIFSKQLFEKTNGYASHATLASGDDVLFLQDVKKIKARVTYLKSSQALVYTYPCYSLSALIQQKIRWTSKFKQTTSVLNFSLALLSVVVNLAWLFCFIYVSCSASDSNQALLFVFIKIGLDLGLLFLASTFIKNKQLIWYALPVLFLYPIYTCLVALASLFVKSKWKP